MQRVLKHQDLNMFCLKLLQICEIFTNFQLWVAVARHNFKGVKIIF